MRDQTAPESPKAEPASSEPPKAGTLSGGASPPEAPAEGRQGPEGERGPDAPAARGEITIDVFGRTDVGQVREHNEDNFVVADLTLGTRGLVDSDRVRRVGERGILLGVCDGMGGAAAGEVASQLAVDIVYQRMSAGEPPKGHADLAARLVEAIEAAGARIFTEAKLDRSRRGMGTTATIAALVDDHLFLGQVGDSRAYVLRGDRLVQTTRDQSLVNQLIEAGQLTPEEAETFEHNNIILQALGTSDTVQVDLTYVELRRGDTLLLCSDGLSGMIRNDEIREILIMAADPVEACSVLTDRANQAGGHDNVTVVVARFDGEGLKPATRADMDQLKYQKYAVPELPSKSEQDRRNASTKPQGLLASLRPAVSLSSAPPDADVAQAEGSSGYDSGDAPFDQPAAHDDAIEIPTDGAPTWLVTMMILSGVACVLVAAYYYLR